MIGLNVLHWNDPHGFMNRIGNWLCAGLNPVIYMVLDHRLVESSWETKFTIEKLGLKKMNKVQPTPLNVVSFLFYLFLKMSF